jgi:hypothetical protein
MNQIIYVVQPFSRGADGALVCDVPAWSKDRSFAASLASALSRSKAGVLTVEASFNGAGEVEPEGEIIASYGRVPTSLVLPARLAQPVSSPLEAVNDERRLRA